MIFRLAPRNILFVSFVLLVGISWVGAQDTGVTIERKTVRNNSDVVLRSGPGIEFVDRGTITENFVLPVTGRNDFPADDVCTGRYAHDITMWLRVQYVEIEVWIWRCHPSVEVNGDIASLPVVEPAFPLREDDPIFPVRELRGINNVEPEGKYLFGNVRTEALVHTAPDLGSEIIGSLGYRRLVYVIGRTEAGGWAKINYRGNEGWVVSHLIYITEGWEMAIPVTP
jgi:hypothetical protein